MSGQNALARFAAVLDEAAAWDESKYERDAAGRFAPKGGGDSGEARSTVMAARAPRAGAKTAATAKESGRRRAATSAAMVAAARLKDADGFGFLSGDPPIGFRQSSTAFGSFETSNGGKPVETFTAAVGKVLERAQKSDDEGLLADLRSERESHAGPTPDAAEAETLKEIETGHAERKAARETVAAKMLNDLPKEFPKGAPTEDEFRSYLDRIEMEYRKGVREAEAAAPAGRTWTPEIRRAKHLLDVVTDSDFVDSLSGDFRDKGLTVNREVADVFNARPGAVSRGEREEADETVDGSYAAINDRINTKVLPSTLRDEGWKVELGVGFAKKDDGSVYGGSYGGFEDAATGMKATKTHDDGSRTEIEAGAEHPDRDARRQYAKGMRFKWTRYDKDGLMRDTGFENTLADAAERSRPKRSLGESALRRFRDLTEACCASCEKGGECEGAGKDGAMPCASKKKKARASVDLPNPPTGPIASVMESADEDGEPLVDTPRDDDDFAVNQAAAEEAEPEAESKEEYRARTLRRSQALAKLRARRDPDGIEPDPASGAVAVAEDAKKPQGY